MYYFIINPASRSASSKDSFQQLREFLDAQNVSYRICPTKYPGHAGKLAREISTADPSAVIVPVGGDGSVHEVIGGLVNLETVTLGLIPLGSGNDFARGMRIPKDPKEAISLLFANHHIASMDIGTASFAGTTMRFAVSAGIGYDASVCYEVNRSSIKTILNRLHLGSFAYTIVALKQFFAYRPCDLLITDENGEEKHYEKAYFAAAMNQEYEGGGFQMTPGASAADGLFDLIIVNNMPRIRLLFALPLAKSGKHTWIRGVHFVKCSSVRIQTEQSLPIHLDGEADRKVNQISISMEKEKLRVIVP